MSELTAHHEVDKKINCLISTKYRHGFAYGFKDHEVEKKVASGDYDVRKCAIEAHQIKSNVNNIYFNCNNYNYKLKEVLQAFRLYDGVDTVMQRLSICIDSQITNIEKTYANMLEAMKVDSPSNN